MYVFWNARVFIVIVEADATDYTVERETID